MGWRQGDRVIAVPAIMILHELHAFHHLHMHLHHHHLLQHSLHQLQCQLPNSRQSKGLFFFICSVTVGGSYKMAKSQFVAPLPVQPQYPPSTSSTTATTQNTMLDIIPTTGTLLLDDEKDS